MMSYEIRLPQVELNMESVTVLRWLIAEGDSIETDQPILEVETQKATVEIPSPASGFVRKCYVAQDDEIDENALLCIVTDTMDEAIIQTTDLATIGSQAQSSEHKAASSISPAPSKGPVRATPVARKVAKQLGIDIQTLQGSGPGGRVTVEDVQSASSSSEPIESQPSNDTSWTTLPPSRMALIAQMQRSLSQIPQIHIVRQIDVTPLLAKQQGVTFTHRLIKSIGSALQQHPLLRTIIDQNKVMACPVSVAVAMDTPRGLIAPVVRHPDQLSINQIADQVKDFALRAETKSIKRHELSNAPFAISNLGMLGVDVFHGFVFDGQTAVLAIGRSSDAQADRKTSWMSLAVDHRIVDGAEAARFLHTLQQEILGS